MGSIGIVQWILNALIAAEAMNVTQSTATEFPTTQLFGQKYEKMFIHAISAVGNFGELYTKHNPNGTKGGNNQTNVVSSLYQASGLHYAPPFGNLDIEQVLDQEDNLPSAVVNGTLESIQESNSIKCAVLESNALLTALNGIDVEYCRAISAAMFKGSIGNIELIPVLSSAEGFTALANHNVDVFVSAKYSMENDVREPSTGLGYSLSPPYFYDTSDDGRISAYSIATRDDDSQFSDFVRWVIWSTIHAEEKDYSVYGEDEDLPTCDLFGPDYVQMFRYVNFAVGHYGDIYNRTQEEFIPRSALNQINQGGPLLVPWIDSFFSS